MSRARQIADFGDGIATADIDDGAVTAAKIGSGAITSAALPAGSVLQVVTHIASGTNSSTTSTSEVALSEYTVSISKKSSNSKIVAVIPFFGYYTSSPTYWWIKARANGNFVTSNSGFNNSFMTHNHRQYTFQEGAHQMYMGQFYDATNASNVEFTFAWQQSTGGSFTFWTGSADPVCVYYEISQ